MYLKKQDSVESTDLPELRVFKRRWYILAVFCGLSCHQVNSHQNLLRKQFQALVWNTWGPIESGAQFAFGWTPSTVAMFANWGTIMFLVSVVPLSKMIEVDASMLTSVCIKPLQVNLRHTVLFVSGLMALGTVLRCGRKFTKLVLSETANQTLFLARYPRQPGRSPYIAKYMYCYSYTL